MIRISGVIAFICGLGSFLQHATAPNEVPVWIAGVSWWLGALGLLASDRAVGDGRPDRAERLFLLVGISLCYIVPMFDSPYGATMVLTVGPLFLTLSLAGFQRPGGRPYLPAALGVATFAGLGVRHMLRPLPGFVNPIDVLFTAAAAGLAVFAIGTLGDRLIRVTMDAQLQSASALERLQRNHEALVASRDQALAASRAKASFLAHMSHELRTPLNAILGYVELIGEEAEADTVLAQDLDRVSIAARHLLSTINEILDLSRIEAGQLDIVAAPIDVPSLCDDMLTLMAPLSAERQRVLERDVAPVSLVSDATRLRQVLVNLLGNAVKFTDRGSVRLQVAAETRADRPGVRFDVVDTGTGIAADALESIFEPFHTTGRGGSGIGLTLSRAVSEQLGGDLRVSSTLGEGSTFTLWVPSRRSDATMVGAVPRGPHSLSPTDDEPPSV